jgi:hypothetical protein
MTEESHDVFGGGSEFGSAPGTPMSRSSSPLSFKITASTLESMDESLVEERLSDMERKTEELLRENELYESYISRFAPHLLPKAGDSDSDATKVKSRRRGARTADRDVKERLTVAHKIEIATGELEEVGHEKERMYSRMEKEIDGVKVSKYYVFLSCF